jgi:hypothetical protein
MNTIQRLLTAAFFSVASAGLVVGGVACDRQEGPLEEAGEGLDDAADDVGDAADDAAR